MKLSEFLCRFIKEADGPDFESMGIKAPEEYEHDTIFVNPASVVAINPSKGDGYTNIRVVTGEIYDVVGDVRLIKQILEHGGPVS